MCNADGKPDAEEIYQLHELLGPKPPSNVILGALAARIGEERSRIGVLNEVAFVQKGGAVAGTTGLLHIVRHQNNGIGLFELVNKFFELGSADGVE